MKLDKTYKQKLDFKNEKKIQTSILIIILENIKQKKFVPLAIC